MNVTYGIYLFNSEKKLLIGHPTNHKWTLWSIPKGRKDGEFESDFNTAKRELLEETNIDLDDFRYNHVEFDLVVYRTSKRALKSYMVKVNYDFSNHDVRCDSMVVWDGNPVFPEIDKFLWVTVDEAKGLLHESQVSNLELCRKLI